MRKCAIRFCAILFFGVMYEFTNRLLGQYCVCEKIWLCAVVKCSKMIFFHDGLPGKSIVEYVFFLIEQKSILFNEYSVWFWCSEWLFEKFAIIIFKMIISEAENWICEPVETCVKSPAIKSLIWWKNGRQTTELSLQIF